MKNNRPKTLFIDIDGVLLYHNGTLYDQFVKEPKLLNKTIEKLTEWESKGYNIILTSGRKKSMRRKLEEQLEKLGIFYDELIVGIGGGDRILINDKKPDGRNTAFCYNLDRNYGISDLDI